MAPFQANRLYTSEEFQKWAVWGRPSSSKSPFGTMWGIVHEYAQWIGVPPTLTSLKNGCLLIIIIIIIMIKMQSFIIFSWEYIINA